MDWGTIIGGGVGAVGGFFVGGPAGAVAGGTLGAGLGGAIEQAASGGGPTNTYSANPTPVNGGAFGATPVNLGAPAPNMAGTSLEIIQRAQQRDAELAALEEQKNKELAGAGSGQWGVNPDAINQAYAQQAAGIRAKYNAPSQGVNQRAESELHSNQLNQLSTNAQAASGRGAPQIDQTTGLLATDVLNQGQDRAGQGAFINTLQDAAAGRGPSAAEATLMQGRDANINQAQSLANSQRGGSGAQALAARSALLAGGMATQNTASQAAILRANEMNAARTQLGTALASQRGGDQAFGASNLGAATSNLGAKQGTTAQNDAASQNWTKLYLDALNGDRDAQIQLEQLKSANANAANGINAGVAQSNVQAGQQNADRNMKLDAALIGAGSTGLAGAATQPAAPAAPAAPPQDPAIIHKNPYDQW